MQSCTTNTHVADAAAAVAWNKFIAIDDDSWINSNPSVETILIY